MHHNHLSDNKNGINVFERKAIGGGRIYQRGTAKNITEGDTFQSYPIDGGKIVYTVDKILSLRDIKEKGEGVYLNPKDRENCLYEAELSIH